MENNGQIVVGLVGADETNFGKWFLPFLKHLPAVSVLLPEPECDINVKDVVNFSDIIIFAVKANKLEETVTEYNNTEELPTGKLWIDVASPNVPVNAALRYTVADAVSLRFDEPSSDIIGGIRLPEQTNIYIYTLELGCANIKFPHLLSVFQHITGVKNIQFIRPPARSTPDVSDVLKWTR